MGGFNSGRQGGTNRLAARREVVDEQVYPPLEYPAHWFGPGGDVDWKAIDIRWAIDHSDRESRLGQLLKAIYLGLHLVKRWLGVNHDKQ